MPTFNDIHSVLEDFCAWASEKRLFFHASGDSDPLTYGEELSDHDRVRQYINERGPIILNARDWRAPDPRPRAHPEPGQVVPEEHPVFVTCDEYKHVPMCGHGSDSNGLIPKPSGDDDPHADFLDAGNPQGHLR